MGRRVIGRACERPGGRSLGLVREQAFRFDRDDDFRFDVGFPVVIPTMQHREDIIRSKTEFIVWEPFERPDVFVLYQEVDEL
jgi:hypothetical protein